MSGIETLLSGMEDHHSLFENAIRELEIPVCAAFRSKGDIFPVSFIETDQVLTTRDSVKVNAAFPQTSGLSGSKVLCAGDINMNPAKGKRVAVLFSGGPAAGGHNVVAGLFRVLGKDNTLLGVKSGPKGLIQGKLFEIDEKSICGIINTGGFDFLGTDRTKIKTDEQFEAVRKTCVENRIDAIVVIGGDDSNTNAAVLAEKLFAGIKPDGSGVQVIGVPKTIDGDLQIGNLLPISFGFDTATKIYAELAGNILQDTKSSLKYWHFIKLMGRAASHVALEVALQIKPAVALISEEVAEKKMSLGEVVDTIAYAVIDRAKKGITHGVVIVPEGLIEFIPEMNTLIEDIDDKMAAFASDLETMDMGERFFFIPGKLSSAHAKLMKRLPSYIQEMLIADRDSHGNLQVSLIPTERLLLDMTATRIAELAPDVSFHTQHHFFGYEGRCGAPTLFDAAYTYNLGLTAGSLILAERTGYIVAVNSFEMGGMPVALPLTGLLNIERRHGKDEMVIEKALVKCDSPAFRYYESRRKIWTAEDHFCSPGPRQLWGPAAHQMPMSVAINREYKTLEFNF
jgi:pyrophosphate--fructose-6-phosphate 1-phosphotransferase